MNGVDVDTQPAVEEGQRKRERTKEEAAKRNVIVAAAAEACSMYTETNGWGGKCCSD